MARYGVVDLVGIRFGRLVVLRDSETRARNGNIRWNCLCDCGAEKEVTSDALRRGMIRSCGCLRAEVSQKRALDKWEKLRMKFIDRTVKQIEPENPYNEPRRAQPTTAPAKQQTAVPDIYRNARVKQAQAEATFSRVLGHIAPELAGEVVRRAATDKNFDAAARAGLDPDGAALKFHLGEIQREIKNAEFRQRLDAAYAKHRHEEE